MSISLEEVITSAGYDLEDLEDLHRVANMLYEAEDLLEEVREKIEYLENYNYEREKAEALADIRIMEARGN